SGASASVGISDCGVGCPRARSSKVTVMVEATVVVRNPRRLQPAALFVEDVIVGRPRFARLRTRSVSKSSCCGRKLLGPSKTERLHALPVPVATLIRIEVELCIRRPPRGPLPDVTVVVVWDCVRVQLCTTRAQRDRI